MKRLGYCGDKTTTHLDRICIQCSSLFSAPRSQCKPRTRLGKIYIGARYCSRSCFTAYFKAHFKPTLGKSWKHTPQYCAKLSASRIGNANPMYAHGEYSGQKRRGLTQPQKVWRKAIFTRDQYTCQLCGAHNGSGITVNLNAHHICPWALFPKKRYELSNGITLCLACHNKVHTLYRADIPVKADVHYYLAAIQRLTELSTCS